MLSFKQHCIFDVLFHDSAWLTFFPGTTPCAVTMVEEPVNNRASPQPDSSGTPSDTARELVPVAPQDTYVASITVVTPEGVSAEDNPSYLRPVENEVRKNKSLACGML